MPQFPTMTFEDDARYEKLTFLVQLVQDNLYLLGINDVQFIIAGGSVFSTLTETSFGDIDVFFHNQEDVDRVCEALLKTIEPDVTYVGEMPNHFGIYNTEKAVSFNDMIPFTPPKSIKQMQFIKCSVGSPDEIFNSFDLNCSKVGIDDLGRVHYSDDFSRYIDVDLSVFRVSTISRYLKYTRYRKAEDNDNSTMLKMIDHLISNPDMIIETGYSDSVTLSAWSVLLMLTYEEDTDKSNAVKKIVYDRICEILPLQERLYIFEKLQGDLMTLGFLDNDEYNLFHVLWVYTKPRFKELLEELEELDPNALDRIKDKYAEYFI
jgi:hypothetical protein